MITAIDYPFEKLTQRYYYRGDIGSNWKIFHDAFQEFYHPPILHGHQNPVMRQTDYQDKGLLHEPLPDRRSRIAWARRPGARAASWCRSSTTPSSS